MKLSLISNLVAALRGNARAARQQSAVVSSSAAILAPRLLQRRLTLVGLSVFCCAMGYFGAPAQAATVPNDPTTLWTAIPFAPGIQSDYITDQQTGSEEGDIVGTNGLPGVYTTYTAGSSPTNGTFGFRFRMGRDASPVGFKAVALVGIDANRDGVLDLFLAVDNTGSSDLIRIFKAGAGLNVSPSTTSIDSQNPLFTYSQTTNNYDWSIVNSTIDPSVLTSTNPTPTNIDGAAGAGQTDYFLSFFVPFSDVVSSLQTVGISGVTSNTSVRYILGSATQPNSINQDINGLNGQVNSTVAYTNLGIFSLPLSPGGATNNSPVANNDSASTSEDTQATISPLVNDTDADGDALTISSATATNGTVSISGTNLVFTPTTNFNGTATIGYTISDGNGGTASAVVTITVSAVNDAPVANNDSASTPEDIQVTIPVLINDSDVDGNALTITGANATNGTVNIVGTNLVFLPATNFNGTATIGYTISDGNGGTASAVVTITVTAVNDAPIAVNDVATTAEDTQVTIPPLVNDTDVEGNILSITGANATNGTVNIVGTNLVFTPATNFNGTATIGYTISDGNGGTASALVTVTVTSVNDAPIAVNDSTTTAEDTQVTIPVLINDSDVDGNTLSITAANATNGTVNIVGTNLLFTPTTNFNGTATISYTISDGNGGTASALVTITVSPVNDAPIAVNDSATTSKNVSVTISPLVNDTDVDGDVLSITGANATNGTVNIVGTNLFFTPTINFVGTATIGYTITDSNGGNAAALVSVMVNAVANIPPVAQNDSLTNAEDIQIVISPLLNDFDVDGDTLTITNASATNGIVSIVGTNLVFTPTTNFNGTATIGYTISDGNGGTASALVTITITAVNDAPFAVNDSLSTAEDTSVTLLPLINDSDIEGDALFILSMVPTNGSVNLVGTNLVFTPNTNFNGTATIGYTIGDGNGGTASAVITITITAVNDAPIAVNDSATTAEDAPITISPLINDIDVDGDTLVITGAVATNGTVNIVGTNLFFTPSTNFNGTATIGYTISDGNGGTASAVVTITVSAVNDAPIAVGDLSLTTGNVPVTISPLVNDTDADGDPLIIISANATNGTVSIVGTNLVFTPTTNFVGTATIGYTISDGNGGTASALITITVSAPGAQFGILAGTNIFNPQTGLFEQKVTVTNTGTITVAGVRLLVGGLRTNVFLQNASGTTNGAPYAQYNSPLNPNQTVMFSLEFYVPDRRPFTNTLTAAAILPPTTGTNAASGVFIDRSFMDVRLGDEPRYVIEFASIPGRTYTIIYSDNLLTWVAATPAVTAAANRTQWYDDGPPKTQTKPSGVAARYYRVILNP